MVNQNFSAIMVQWESSTPLRCKPALAAHLEQSDEHLPDEAYQITVTLPATCVLDRQRFRLVPLESSSLVHKSNDER